MGLTLCLVRLELLFIRKHLNQIEAEKPGGFSRRKFRSWVKGYGDSCFPGSRGFESVMQTLLRLRHMGDSTDCLKDLGQAALADDTGKKLEKALAKLNLPHGGSL